jgi:hypothetical protein
MPTIKRFRRCRIEMYFADHPPPHFHIVTRNDERVAVTIDTVAIWAGEADGRDIAEGMSWAKENRAELRQRWRAYSEKG